MDFENRAAMEYAARQQAIIDMKLKIATHFRKTNVTVREYLLGTTALTSGLITIPGERRWLLKG